MVQRGFALPTVLITSVAMMIVLLAALTSISSISTAINNQYYDKLVSQASESGLAMAKACIKQNGSVTWSASSPLRPNTTCNGGSACSPTDTNPNCYVIKDSRVRTTFTVGSVSLDANGRTYSITASSSVDLLRTSTGTVRKSLTSSRKLAYEARVTATLASGAGWKESSYSGHNGYLLATNGRIYGWGANFANQLSDASTSSYPKPIEVALPTGYAYAKSLVGSGQGASFICAIFAHINSSPSNPDTVFCRGGGLAMSDDNGGGSQLTGGWTKFVLPSDDNVPVQISINGYGREAVCVLTKVSGSSGGRIYCAGNDRDGMFGRASGQGTPGNDVPLSSPVMFFGNAPGGRFIKVFAQDNHVCAIGASSPNKAYCAGENGAGQLGRGNTNTSLSVQAFVDDVPLPTGTTTYDVKMPYHSGGSSALYFNTSDGVFMTGSNKYGTANDNNSASVYYTTPRRLASYTYNNLIAVGKDATGNSSLCIGYRLSSSQGPPDLQCMGDRSYGQIARGSCAVDSPIRTWGISSFTPSSAKYAPPSGSDQYNLAHDSGYHMASLTVIDSLTGDAYSAGSNQYGKLGTQAPMGSMCNSTLERVKLPAGVKAIAVSNSDEYSMYILGDDNNVYASGRNNQGQLGNNSTTNSNVPVKVQLPKEASTIF